jgi:crotonobetainyl-CoA:carnitine CoA-transferase CaiB-like acyl-CoA transferase
VADRPLTGIRVLDFSRLIPGPYCTLLLARLGAEVIKVETPLAGDWARYVPPELGYGTVFESLNAGKRSLAINYRNPAGKAAVLRLVDTVDVFVDALTPGALSARGLGPDELLARNPRLVYCSLSGYGQSGPSRDEPGHDLSYLARGGLLSLLTDAEQRPIAPGIQLADLAGGLLAVTSILGALYARERTGRGGYVDVAMIDVVTSWVRSLVGEHGDSRPAAMASALGGTLPCYNVYRAGDGRYLALAALEPRLWVAFCDVVERPDLADRNFDPTAVAEVAALLGTRPAAEWAAREGASDACLVVVNAPIEAAADPQVALRSDVAWALARDDGSPAPALGRDSVAILSEAGYDEATIRGLEADGVITTPASDHNRAAARIARITPLARAAVTRDREGTAG